ncbi:MAG: MarR family winged helix-turn-helix transcriptional regulator [Deltaproteobacteria bacterium]
MSGLSTQQFTKEAMVIMPALLRSMHKIQSDAVMRGHITVPQFLVLEFVIRRGELKMGDVARELRVSTPAATGLVNRMHRLGMVARRYDPKDRRIIRIVATPKGRRMVHTLFAERRRMIARLFGRLTPMDRAAYLKILKKVYDVAVKSDSA